jgi:enoyl-CoA hydratase/carnithine racemase
VNGLVVGGGVELFINCDMVFCSPLAVLSLPDVKVGLSLLGGTLPLLVRKTGHGRATDMVLTGRNVGIDEALMRGLVDKVVENPAEEAVKIAKVIAENSPDAVWASREGIFLGLGEKGSFEAGKEFKNKHWASFLGEGRDSEEGIAAFVERRKPKLDRN